MIFRSPISFSTLPPCLLTPHHSRSTDLAAASESWNLCDLTITYKPPNLRNMKTKLTLSVDPVAVSKVKRLAKRKGVSVSGLFEQWSMRMVDRTGDPPLGKRLRGQWKGSATSGPDPRLQYLLEKHTDK